MRTFLGAGFDFVRLMRTVKVEDRAYYAAIRDARRAGAEPPPMPRALKFPMLRVLDIVRRSRDIKMMMLVIMLFGVCIGVSILFCNQAIQLKNGETQLEKFDRKGRGGHDWRTHPGWRAVLRMEHSAHASAANHDHAD